MMGGRWEMAWALHTLVDMTRIVDALELLTEQHDEIDALISELQTTATPTARNATVSLLVDKVAAHLSLEQELFYPAVASALTTDVHAELLAEHAEIKRILADMLWLESEDTRFEHKLGALQGLLCWHSMWQERELFEKAAETMTANQLATLCEHMNRYLGSSVSIAA